MLLVTVTTFVISVSILSSDNFLELNISIMEPPLVLAACDWSTAAVLNPIQYLLLCLTAYLLLRAWGRLLWPCIVAWKCMNKLCIYTLYEYVYTSVNGRIFVFSTVNFCTSKIPCCYLCVCIYGSLGVTLYNICLPLKNAVLKQRRTALSAAICCFPCDNSSPASFMLYRDTELAWAERIS